MSSNPDFTEHPAYEEPFWQGAKEGKLLIQECDSCGKRQFYPRVVCRYCQSRAVRYIESAGKGTIYSYTIVERAATEWQHLTPYALIVVELDEGTRITSRIVDSPVSEVKIGSRVTVTYGEVADGVVMPLFKLA